LQVIFFLKDGHEIKSLGNLQEPNYGPQKRCITWIIKLIMLVPQEENMN